MTRIGFGAVLAGGAGRRFRGGRTAKPGALVGGVSMAARAVQALRPHARDVGIVGPAATSADDAFLRRIGVEGVPLRRDEEPDRGPLEGLRVALRWAAELGAPEVALLPCDLPLVDGDVVGRLVRAFRAAPSFRDAVVPVAGGRAQPLAGVYRTRVADAVEDRLAGGGEPSLRALLADLEVERVHVEELGADPDRFLNVNRAEDLARAERVLSRFARARRESPEPAP